MKQPSMQEDMVELRAQLAKGAVQRAYRALISFMSGLRTHFGTIYGDSFVTGIYQGYLDMTYFALLPLSLKERGLKVAVVFNYDTFRFEGWLAARNRTLQRQYWDMFRTSGWAEYPIIAPAPGIDAIVECVLADEFDLDNPDALTVGIEKNATAFIGSIERFLADRA